jgi:hypothetical protein
LPTAAGAEVGSWFLRLLAPTAGHGANEEPTTVEPWARFLQMCQYSSGRRKVVALRSASVMHQNFTP